MGALLLLRRLLSLQLLPLGGECSPTILPRSFRNGASSKISPFHFHNDNDEAPNDDCDNAEFNDGADGGK